ncbi:MAG: M20/M25/M40 family metallo-hydrolase [Nitrospira sp.]|nr:M20/M25/M40 family metallo-hydrolase [Nitrospira sp.]
MTSSLTIAFLATCRMALCVMILGLIHAEPVPAQPSDTGLQTSLNTLSTERMLADIQALSAPAFNGRQAATPDDLQSGLWVWEALRVAGMRFPSLFNGQLMIPMASGKEGSALGVMAAIIPAPHIETDPTVHLGTADQLVTTQIGADYLPVFDSPSANVQGQIVFVGYGIVDPARGIDDYAGVDVANRIVLFLRGKPDHYPKPVSHADKVRFARDRGALAYLTATGPILNSYDTRRGVTGRPSAFYGQLPPDHAIPGTWISTALAEQVLATPSDANRLRHLQEQLNKDASARAVQTDHYAALRWNAVTQEGLLTNVIGLLSGTGPDAIIIGAHRDHFGRPAGLLFPGADDNASGTAVMLEVARALTKSGMRPQRTILFVSFSGEERDLLGSRLYVTRPIVPLASTKAMINIDHAGIGNGRLTVGVTGLEKVVAQQAGEPVGLASKLDVFGFFPGGDHVPFKEAGVPTITVVSGGVHPHYHQPTDTTDTIDPDVLMTTARYVLSLAWQLANEP